MGYTLKTSIDLSQIKDLKRDEPLLVAAARGGRILASREIDLLKVKTTDKIPVELCFDLPAGDDAAGIELRIGPAVPEAMAASVDAHVERLDLHGKPSGVIELPAQRISDRIYLDWWRICRRYTVTGRLVRRVLRGDTLCYEPVPGASVELYDVDSLFFWRRKSLITTTPTDVNGYFTATFRWCCWRGWFPPFLPWYIDYPRWDKLRGLLDRLRYLVPHIPWPGDPNPPDPLALMRLATSIEPLFDASPAAARPKRTGFAAASFAPAASFASARLAPAVAPASLAIERSRISSASASLSRVTLSGEARSTLGELRALYPRWWWGNDCYPDLLIRATQIVGGVSTVVYDEPYAATRFDVQPVPSPYDVGNLLANEHAIAVSTCGVENLPGDCFKLTDVGAIQVSAIGSITTGGPLAGFAFAGTDDQPFGGTLELFGAFGQVTKTVPASYVDYLKLQVADWNGNPATLPSDAAFADVPFDRLKPVVRSYWGVVGGTEQWIPYNFGPDASGRYRTQESFQREYEAAHGGPPGPWGWIWTHAQWIATLDTAYLVDGLKVVRAIGFRSLGGGNFAQRVMLNCTLPGHPQTTELLPLHLDNTPLTDVVLSSVWVNGALKDSVACQELELKQGDVVKIGFRVDDPRRHLHSFSLVEHHRLDCAVSLLGGVLHHSSPPPLAARSSYGTFIGDVGAAFRPEWEGGTYTVEVTVGAPPPAGASCNDCGDDRPYFPFSGAYDVRLGAWKRSTNGYGRLFDDESNLLFVVNRTDAPH
jgi:hypothetical protein